MVLAVAPGPKTWTPTEPLPAIRLPRTVLPLVPLRNTPSVWLGRAARPETSVPILLAARTLPEAPRIWTPTTPLPEIRLPAPAAAAPIEVLLTPFRNTPSWALGRARVPVTSVPILLPRITLPIDPAPPISMPLQTLPEKTLASTAETPPIVL